jgi:hypothetical protein
MFTIMKKGQIIVFLLLICLLFVLIACKDNRNLPEKNNSTGESTGFNCEKKTDCYCSSSCGCVSRDMKDAFCEVLPVDKICHDNCGCINKRCTVDNGVFD